jgi:hypothetical protein
MSQPASRELEELRLQLHEANEHFRQSRLEWEKWLAASEYRHDERIAAAREKLREAEREVEEIEERIAKSLMS